MDPRLFWVTSIYFQTTNSQLVDVQSMCQANQRDVFFKETLTHLTASHRSHPAFNHSGVPVFIGLNHQRDPRGVGSLDIGNRQHVSRRDSVKSLKKLMGIKVRTSEESG